MLCAGWEGDVRVVTCYVHKDLSGQEAEPTALVVPAEGEAAQAFELTRGELGRLPSLDHGFQDIRREKDERQGATNLSRIPLTLPRDIAYRYRPPLYQIIHPAMRVREQAD